MLRPLRSGLLDDLNSWRDAGPSSTGHLRSDRPAIGSLRVAEGHAHFDTIEARQDRSVVLSTQHETRPKKVLDRRSERLRKGEISRRANAGAAALRQLSEVPIIVRESSHSPSKSLKLCEAFSTLKLRTLAVIRGFVVALQSSTSPLRHRASMRCGGRRCVLLPGGSTARAKFAPKITSKPVREWDLAVMVAACRGAQVAALRCQDSAIKRGFW